MCKNPSFPVLCKVCGRCVVRWKEGVWLPYGGRKVGCVNVLRMNTDEQN